MNNGFAIFNVGTYHSHKASPLANVARRIDMKKWLGILLSFQFIILTPAFCAEDDFVKSTQNDIILVGVAGGAGAILGLSTLSFYKDPSNHIPNIWTGAAIGVIVGVIWVAFNSAQRGSEDLVTQQTSPEFRTSDRVKWHTDTSKNLSYQPVQYGTQIWQTSF
jgi:hypothetical protein